MFLSDLILIINFQVVRISAKHSV